MGRLSGQSNQFAAKRQFGVIARDPATPRLRECRVRNANSLVIPGRPEGLSPESIATGRGDRHAVHGILANNNSLWLWIPGSRFARPGMTGPYNPAPLATASENDRSTIALASSFCLIKPKRK